MKRRYIFDGKLYESAPVGLRTDKNWVQTNGIRDWIVPVGGKEAREAEARYGAAKLLRKQLEREEQALYDLNIDNYVYITGVHHKR